MSTYKVLIQKSAELTQESVQEYLQGLSVGLAPPMLTPPLETIMSMESADKELISATLRRIADDIDTTRGTTKETSGEH